MKTQRHATGQAVGRRTLARLAALALLTAPAAALLVGCQGYNQNQNDRDQQGQRGSGGSGSSYRGGSSSSDRDTRSSNDDNGGFLTNMFGPRREAQVPSGTPVTVRIGQSLDSGTASTGDHVSATVVSDVMADGHVVIPAGSSVNAHVGEVRPAKRFGGQAMVSVVFDSVDVAGTTVPLEGSIAAAGKKQTGKDTGIIAGSAVGGAVLGKVLGGDDKDAAAGAVVGGGIGTAVASKRGDEAELSSGAEGVAHTTGTVSVPVG